MISARLLQLLRTSSTLIGHVDLAEDVAVEVVTEGDLVLYIVAEGRLFIDWPEDGAVPIALAAGDMILVPQGRPHRVRTTERAGQPMRLTDVIPRRPPASYAPFKVGPGPTATRLAAATAVWREGAEAVAAAALQRSYLVSGDEHPSLRRLAAAIVGEMERFTTVSTIVLGHLVNALVIGIVGAAAPSSGGIDATRTPVPRALTALLGDLEHTTVSELATASRTSPATLGRRFREAVGMSPGRYRTSLRLRRAASLLAATEASVGDVAREVGYRSVPSFVKAFRAYHGATPGAWRLRAAADVSAADQPARVSIEETRPSRKL